MGNTEKLHFWYVLSVLNKKATKMQATRCNVKRFEENCRKQVFQNETKNRTMI